MVKSILNIAYYKQVVKRVKEKTLFSYIQECLSVQDVKMILYPLDNNIILQYKNKCIKYEKDYNEYINNKNKIIIYNTIINLIFYFYY
jgi:hypothetical protein